MKLCPNCKKNKAINDPSYGLLDCLECQDKQSSLKSPNRTVEFTTEQIKWDRKEYEEDTVQPFRDGVLSKEFVDIHGAEGVKEVIDVSDEEIANAKYVWEQHGDTGTSYYKKNI